MKNSSIREERTQMRTRSSMTSRIEQNLGTNDEFEIFRQPSGETQSRTNSIAGSTGGRSNRSNDSRTSTKTGTTVLTQRSLRSKNSSYGGFSDNFLKTVPELRYDYYSDSDSSYEEEEEISLFANYLNVFKKCLKAIPASIYYIVVNYVVVEFWILNRNPPTPPTPKNQRYMKLRHVANANNSSESFLRDRLNRLSTYMANSSGGNGNGTHSATPTAGNYQRELNQIEQVEEHKGAGQQIREWFVSLKELLSHWNRTINSYFTNLSWNRNEAEENVQNEEIVRKVRRTTRLDQNGSSHHGITNLHEHQYENYQYEMSTVLDSVKQILPWLFLLLSFFILFLIYPYFMEFHGRNGQTVQKVVTIYETREASPESPKINVEIFESKFENIHMKIENLEKDLNEKIERLDGKHISLKLTVDELISKGVITRNEIVQEILNLNLGEYRNGRKVTLLNVANIWREGDEEYKEAVRNTEEKFENLLKKKIEDSEFEQRASRHFDWGKLEEELRVRLVEEVSISCKKDCPIGEGASGLSSEDIEKLIRMAIRKYDADKTGMPDLGLEPAGGSILSTRCTKTWPRRNSVISIWGFKLWSPANNPRVVIQPGIVPGECWAFEGSIGDIVIKLIAPSFVTGFTLEHIPKEISPYNKIESAPQKFQVIGLNSEHDFDTMWDYGNYTFEDNGEPIQYFKVLNQSTNPYPIVELKILSNHGHQEFTCLYRFRVHGALDFDSIYANKKATLT